MKKTWLGLSLGLVAVMLAVLATGCATVTNTANPASPPSGTTTIAVGSGGSATLTANAKTGAASIVVMDQLQNPITSTNNLNIKNITIDIWSTTTTTQTAVVDTITYSGGSAAQAISYAMTLDRSGSMSSDSNASLESAAVAFINQSGATDQGAIFNFDSYVVMDQALTTDKDLLKVAATMESISGGSTALYDSIGFAILTVEAGANARKAVIAMTDGGENNSVTYNTTGEVVTLALAKSIPVYTVGLGLTAGGADENNLKGIATGSGGFYYYAPTATDIVALYSKVASALNSSWTVNFTSPVTFVTSTTYYVKITVTYDGGITNSVTFTVTV
ncbi:MAG: VWA domain-containing protein [Candidatus Margulisiibacteriota bacterium]